MTSYILAGMSCDAAGLSMKAPIHVGSDHGVFVQGGSITTTLEKSFTNQC